MLAYLVESFYDWLFRYLLNVILDSRSRNATNTTTTTTTTTPIVTESEEQLTTSRDFFPSTGAQLEATTDDAEANCNIQVCYLDQSEKRICKFNFNVPKSMTVREIKSKLANCLCDKMTQTTNLAIVFMGKELSDNLEISGCDLGDYSILHALDVKGVQLTAGLGGASMSPNISSDDAPNKLSTKLLTTIEEIDSPNQSKFLARDTASSVHQKLYFYVYCHNCAAVRNGKLRVACSGCNAGSILCLSEPSNWSDVMEEHRIAAKCYNPECAVQQQWAHFFFKCVNESDHLEMQNGQVEPLNRVRYNYIEATCLACFEARLQVLVFACGHVLCLGCFSDYSSSSLSQRKLTLVSPYGFTVNCPLNCDQSWLEASHFFLLDTSLYTLYSKIQNEEITRKNGGIFCPYPDCDQAFYPTMGGDQNCYMTKCDKCQKMWCVPCTYKGDFLRNDCLLTDEINQQNQLDKSTDRNVNDSRNSYLSELIDKFRQIALGSSQPSQSHRWQDAQSRYAVQQIARPCPQCRVPTERAGGCMHISCEACAFEWCWICCTEWTRDCMTMHWFG